MNIKISIIGYTGHIEYVLNSLGSIENLELSAAVGSKGEKPESLKSRIQSRHVACRYYDSYVEMMDREKPDIAVVACYFGDHAKVIIEALKRGIHVFTEKPVATTLEDLDAIRREYEKSRLFVGAMFGIRYTPWFYTAKQVSIDAIGEIRLINAQKSYKLGTRGENFKKHELYGGTIPWVGSHAIDWLYWFSGGEFQSVFATQSRLFNENNGDLEMSALCQFTFSNEVFGSVSIDYLRPENAPTHADDRLRVVGTKGVIEVRDEKVYLINDEIKGIRELPLLRSNEIFIDFLNPIIGKGECMISPEDAFKVTEASLFARKSAEVGQILYFNS